MRDEKKIATAVLIGGHSSRMGRPKENVVIEGDGRTFLEKICDEVDECFPKIICKRYISVRKGQSISKKGYETVEDVFDDIGPLGGLVSVLQRAKRDGACAVLLLACDMIRYDAGQIRSVCASYAGEDILWARSGNKHLEPLASIYSTSILDAAVIQAKGSDHRLRFLEKTVKRIGYYDSAEPLAYENINSMAEALQKEK